MIEPCCGERGAIFFYGTVLPQILQRLAVRPTRSDKSQHRFCIFSHLAATANCRSPTISSASKSPACRGRPLHVSGSARWFGAALRAAGYLFCARHSTPQYAGQWGCCLKGRRVRAAPPAPGSSLRRCGSVERAPGSSSSGVGGFSGISQPWPYENGPISAKGAGAFVRVARVCREKRRIIRDF